MRKLIATSIALSLCALFAGPTVALAATAPTRVSSEPEPGEELHAAPEKVSITYDQPLDPASFIAVENHCGDRVDDKETTVTGTSMEVDLTGRSSGTYHVTHYAKGLAGVTGEQTAGFTFVVHGGPSCGQGEGHHHGDGDHEGGHDDDGGDHSGDDHSGTGHSEDGDEDGHSAGAHSSSSDPSHDGMDESHDDGSEAHDEHEDAAAIELNARLRTFPH